MLLVGTMTGGALAFVTFALVVVSAPMLLNPQANVFAAVIGGGSELVACGLDTLSAHALHHRLRLKT